MCSNCEEDQGYTDLYRYGADMKLQLELPKDKNSVSMNARVIILICSTSS